MKHYKELFLPFRWMSLMITNKCTKKMWIQSFQQQTQILSWAHAIRAINKNWLIGEVKTQTIIRWRSMILTKKLMGKITFGPAYEGFSALDIFFCTIFEMWKWPENYLLIFRSMIAKLDISSNIIDSGRSQVNIVQWYTSYFQKIVRGSSRDSRSQNDIFFFIDFQTGIC